MADNVTITAGVGTSVSTDEVGGVHYQEMKLVNGTKDSATPVAVDVGPKANALRVAPANDITDATYIGDIKFGEAEPNSAAILADTTAILADTSTIAGDTTSIDGKITACNTGAVVLAAGANSIGILGANSGVDIGDVDVTSIVPGVAATNLGKAEDAAHSSGDVGVMALAVRQSAQADFGADGDYVPMSIDDNGALRVSGGGGGTEYTEDAAAPANPVGGALMAERDDVLGGLTPVAGDWSHLFCSAEGALWVQDFNSDAALALLGTMDADTGTIAGDTTSIDGKITACDTGAVVLSSGTVTTVSTVTNLSQLGGTAISMNEGALDAGVQRVSLATDDDAVAHLATIAGDTTAIETAVQIIDDWDAVHDSAASSDGPQLMAAYDATKPTAVADGDAVRVLADEYGRLLSGVEKTAWQAVYDSADATAEAEVVKASAASTIVVVQSYVISSDVEGWIKLQDEDSTALTGKFWLKAGGGVAITLPDKAPIVLGVDKDLEVIAEAAGNVSVSATGYTIPG
jgi:hypothetical protein